MEYDHETLMAIKASFGCAFINQNKQSYLTKQLQSNAVKDINNYLQSIETKLNDDFNYVFPLGLMPELRCAVLTILDHISTSIRLKDLETTPPNDGLCGKCGVPTTFFYEVESVKMCDDCLMRIADVWNKKSITSDPVEYEKRSRILE